MGKLFVIPTPVGNLEDITFRAVRLLKEVDIIYAEDTRTSGVLLKHFEISNKLYSYHIFNEHQIVEDIVTKIESGLNIALISDAGTPGISDPGFLLIRECIRHEIEVDCLPGATSFVPALVMSGLPSDHFSFEGFLPHKKGRQTKISSLLEEKRTMIFFESPFRLVKTLEQFCVAFGEDRQASVSREISKMFQETRRGTLKEILTHFSAKQVKGEIVMIVSGKN